MKDQIDDPEREGVGWEPLKNSSLTKKNKTYVPNHSSKVFQRFVKIT
jgi:hypothetical protein